LDGTQPALHTYWDRNETGRNQKFSAGLRALIKVAVLLVFVGGGGTGWRTPVQEMFADKRKSPTPTTATPPAQAKDGRRPANVPRNVSLIDQVNDEPQEPDAAAPAAAPPANPSRPVGPQRQPEPPPDDPSLPAMTFAVGDKVEANWTGGQWTKATVIRVSGKYARVHYDGWGNDWDEWFPADRLRRRAQ
jgi:hypothetical protein